MPRATVKDNAGKGTIQLKSSNKTEESASSKPTVQLKATNKSNAGKGTIRLDASKAQPNKASVDAASKTVNLKGPKASAKTVSLKTRKDASIEHSDPTINFDSSGLADDAGLDDVHVKEEGGKKSTEGPIDFILALASTGAAGYLLFVLLESMKIYS